MSKIDDDDDDDPERLRRRLKEAESARDAALAARARDRREAQHLLRNMLAVIRSLARRSGDGAADVDDYRSLLDGRLAAFFGVQSALALAPERGIDLGNLIGDQLLRFGLRVDEQVAISGEPVRLTARAAGLLALAFHELAADYVASGSAERAHGLSVRWAYRGDQANGLKIDWLDQDEGPREAESERCRAWLEWLDQAITYELDGRTDIAHGPGRPRYSVHLPAGCCLSSPA
jgi:two-component system CheB/CheR fusion protein